MKKLRILLFALALGGCAEVQNAWNVVAGASVTDQQVYIARSAFDALEATATNYIVYCKVHPATKGCSKSAIAQIIPAVRSGRVARSNLVQFAKDHPGQLGSKGLYDALVSATNTLQSISAQYNIAGVTQ